MASKKIYVEMAAEHLPTNRTDLKAFVSKYNRTHQLLIMGKPSLEKPAGDFVEIALFTSAEEHSVVVCISEWLHFMCDSIFLSDDAGDILRDIYFSNELRENLEFSITCPEEAIEETQSHNSISQ